MRWLNEDLRLSPPVTSFEEDFANGYRFGQILNMFNQQVDFSQFTDDDKSDTKIHNFSRLRPTLDRLQVPFDTRTVQYLMAGKRGAAVKVLYQLKTSLEEMTATQVGRHKGDQLKLAQIQKKVPQAYFCGE